MPVHYAAFLPPLAAKPLRCSPDAPALFARPPAAAAAATRKRAAVRAHLSRRPPPEPESNPLRITQLQHKLDHALAAEQYTCAATLRDQLRSAQNEHYIQVLHALLHYYHAFNTRSLHRLARMWRRCEHVTCQHPLTNLHRGYHAVMRSFEALFHTLPPDLNLRLSDVRVHPFGHVAVATCVQTPRSTVLDGMHKAVVQRHRLLATCIFEKHPVAATGRFQYLMVHHASAPIIHPASST